MSVWVSYVRATYTCHVIRVMFVSVSVSCLRPVFVSLLHIHIRVMSVSISYLRATYPCCVRICIPCSCPYLCPCSSPCKCSCFSNMSCPFRVSHVQVCVCVSCSCLFSCPCCIYMFVFLSVFVCRLLLYKQVST